MKVQDAIEELRKVPSNSFLALYSFKGQPRLVAVTPDNEIKGIRIPVISPYKDFLEQLKK